MAKIRKSAKKFVEPHTDPLVQKVADAQKTSESQVIEITDEDIVSDDAPRLEMAEIKELQLLNFALRCYAAERELNTMKRDEFLKMVDPGGILRNYAGTIQHLTSEHNTTMIQMNKLVESIQTRLNIDLKKHTYNEETGVLTKLED